MWVSGLMLFVWGFGLICLGVFGMLFFLLGFDWVVGGRSLWFGLLLCFLIYCLLVCFVVCGCCLTVGLGGRM